VRITIILCILLQAIRRTCDNLTVAVEGLQTSLIDKIDRNIAELIVQKKYEDIVQYLQDALEASSEDEDNFKNVALELEEKIKKLASTKSDRLEIQPIQESLVKAESTIAKLLTQQREVGKSDDVFSKDEVMQLMEMKVDKESFDDQVNNVIKSRRGKKLHGATHHDEQPVTTYTKEPGSDDPFAQSNLQPPSQLTTKKSSHGFPTSTPGLYRAPSEGGRAGGSNRSADQKSSVYSATGYKGVPPGGFPPANGAIALSKSAGPPVLTRRISADDGDDPNTIDDLSVELNTGSRARSPETRNREEMAYMGAITKGGGFNTFSQTGGKPPVIGALANAYQSGGLASPEKDT
jgi:hypothetical protein